MTLLLAVFTAAGAWAQSSVVTVGSTTYGHSYLPSYPNGKYATSQQIYTSSEIGKAGLITSIAFYNYDTGSERSYDIYLSYTNKSAFDSTTDWVKVTESNKVYSGKVWLMQGVWAVIEFDTPFQYDGSQSLLLTVDDNTGQSTGYNHNVGAYAASGHQALFCYDSANLDPTQTITEEGVFYPSYSSSDRKNALQLCFETYPKPVRLSAPEIGDVSAQIQCTLRGGATAWNLRYRKVGDANWTTFDNLTTRSKTIEGLTATTKYEAQVQGIFEGGNKSDWTDALVFTTNCCPVEQQTELIYALRSNYSSWYGFAVQIMDITDETKPVEVAYLHAPSYELYGGTVTLCCGHKYKVNWIHDAEHENVSNAFSFALYLEPGDLVYSMARGDAPGETAELTTFVADCGNFCAPKPKNVSVAGTTFNSATISFVSETKGGEVAYSTTPDFDPSTATPTSVTFDAIVASDDPWGGTPDNASLTLKGLEPLTEYYVRVRNVCIDELTGEPTGRSRWSNQVKVTTGSRYDAPSQITAKPVNSRTEHLSWSGRGHEKAYNLFYRPQVTGNTVDMSAIQTFGIGKGTGFKNGEWGPGIWSSYGDRPFSNTVFVGNVPAGSSFSFKAGNGKTGGGKINFLYGMVKKGTGKTAKETMEKFDKRCLNDADRAAIIKGLKDKLKELTDEQQIAAYNAEIKELESLPTDAQKLEQMKELEQKINDNNAELAQFALKYGNDQISKEEYEQQRTVLEAQNALYGSDLSELRAITTNAENPKKDGFAISREDQSSGNQAPARRADADDTYVFFIRHSDPNGVMLMKDLIITPPDQQGEWIKIPNITGTEYTLTGLEPSTTYEVKVEPIYENNLTGTHSPVTVFTTLGKETDPVAGYYSVSESKKVNFAHGNLRCEGERYEDEWSMAQQQYEVLGQDNIEVSGSRSYPAWLIDLFCWSTLENYYGVSSYYYYDDDEAKPYFNGDFADWGECPSLIRDLGPGWRTLSKAEWNYLLNERKDAAQLRSVATVAGVKGLVLLPDEWTPPVGIQVKSTMTAEEWAVIEETGVVFLPAAGQMTTTYVDYNAATTVTDAGTYWTSTPAGDKSDMKAYVLTITDAGVTLDSDLLRRTATAVRLVKADGTATAIRNASAIPARLTDNHWYTLDGRRLSGKPAQPGLYIINGKKYIIR